MNNRQFEVTAYLQVQDDTYSGEDLAKRLIKMNPVTKGQLRMREKYID